MKEGKTKERWSYFEKLFYGSHAGNLEELGHPTEDKNHRFILRIRMVKIIGKLWGLIEFPLNFGSPLVM